MTDIRTMPAGREMDALVAEKVMGWHMAEAPLGCLVWEDANREYQHTVQDYEASDFLPSTDIAAAWEVVEKFHPSDSDEGYNVQLDGHGEGYTFHIFKDATCYEGEADTAPAAICLAALLAVETRSDD